MTKKLERKYGLSEKVVYCKRCVMSNQKPSSIPEFLHLPDRRSAHYLNIDKDGICDACRYAEIKEQIDWEARANELLELLDKHRRRDGYYDCVVPGSGGKDSGFTAHLLKYKYGMHPLTVTWPPILYTEYGLQNFRDWLEIGGFDNITFKPDGRVHKLLTRLATRNLLHPFQTFILGQYHIAPKIAIKFGIPLIFYGESPAEYGNPIAETKSALKAKSYHTMRDLLEVYIAGVSVPELIEKYDLSLNDLTKYLPPHYDEFEDAEIEWHQLGYYLRWTPQEAYYYAVEHTGFQARPVRSEGTYSKYSSIDDKIDDLHYYTTYVKFGLGRTSYDASQEIRNKHLTREEGIALVQQFDGEFPTNYFQEVMDYIDMEPDEFMGLCDEARSPHLWARTNGEWQLRHPIWEEAA